MIASLRALLDDPDWSPSLRQVNDYRGITELVLTPEHMQAIAALEREREQRGFTTPGRVAVVVLNDLYAALARLFQVQAQSQSREVRVYRSMDEAAAWLSLPPEPSTLFDAPHG